MNIDDLTIGQTKELAKMFSCSTIPQTTQGIDTFALGKDVIIRTYSAGVWFGTLAQKAGKEVILKDARRMWRWWAAESISLSAVAIHGIKREKSKIAEAVNSVWLEAIEIIPCTDIAVKSIGGAEIVNPD